MNKNFDFQEKLKLICKRVVKPQWFIFKDHIVGVRIIQLLDKYIYHLFSKSKICSIIYVMLLYKKKKGDFFEVPYAKTISTYVNT